MTPTAQHSSVAFYTCLAAVSILALGRDSFITVPRPPCLECAILTQTWQP
jgi:hypothetical protein